MSTPAILLIAGIVLVLATIIAAIHNFTRPVSEVPRVPKRVIGGQLYGGGPDPKAMRDDFDKRFRAHLWLLLPAFIGLSTALIGGIWLIVNTVVGA